jgi:hypothetical protein
MTSKTETAIQQSDDAIASAMAKGLGNDGQTNIHIVPPTPPTLPDMPFIWSGFGQQQPWNERLVNSLEPLVPSPSRR